MNQLPFVSPANMPRSILVTGGTGSFGRAFVRFLLSQPKVERVCVYSRGEHAQAAMQAEFTDSRLRWMIGDVRNLSRLTRAMQGVDTVIHAAALKRIEVGAYNPDEMALTNVIGTMNVVEAACNARRVARVVGLSTDKAYAPISPYGLSKGLAEAILLAANVTHAGAGPKFAVTRYGNVTGSQGSVLPKWKALAEQGKPITLTDSDCTRFHMTMDEAVSMVWGLANTLTTNLIIPDWLPAYRLGDLAKAFRDLYHIEVIETGLPKFEKLHESMSDELCSKTARRLTRQELIELIK